MFKRAIQMGLILFLPILISAQNTDQYNQDFDFHNKWDLGIFLGLSQNGSDTQSWGMDGESLFNQTHFAYGLNLKYNTSESFGVRLNFWRSEITGTDVDIENEFSSGHDARGFSFDSPITELSLVGQYEFLKKDSDKKVHPYVFGGLGLSFTNPTVEWNDIQNTTIDNDIANLSKTNLQIPIGVGINFDLSDKIYLGLEASSRVPLNDYLDGISEAANPDQNDSYQFVGINLGIRLDGEDLDMDNDGIKDVDDACPKVPGKSSLQGCPDSDNDGVADSSDNCPNKYGLAALGGCPDSDNDGVRDLDDDCPEVAGVRTLRGCPDTDGDGIADKDDDCPNEAGTKARKGCPGAADTDMDGFADDVDNCPTVKGTINGCPDTDGDGIADNLDKCPTVKGNLQGCPDTDKDGIADNLDKCPTVAGVASNNGCPQKRIITTAPVTTAPSSSVTINNYSIRDLHFNTNSAGLTDDSKRRIDEIVGFASQYPEAFFHIAGYTDNIGNADANQRLSERRAKMVYNTLIARGINPNRMTYRGYGETEFIDTNDTESGRFNNRRVECRASTIKK